MECCVTRMEMRSHCHMTTSPISSKSARGSRGQVGDDLNYTFTAHLLYGWIKESLAPSAVSLRNSSTVQFLFCIFLNAGGFISFNGSWRVQGILAMSRSLGDYPLKNLNVVIPDPDIMTFDLDKLQPEFMILASDGLWDAFSNEEAVRFVRERLDEPHFGAKSIVLQSFYRGCPDNITVMVVKFKSGRAGSKAGE